MIETDTRLGGLIDVHAHYVTPADEAGKADRANNYLRNGFLAPPFSEWNVEDTLQFMDDHGIDVQLLSASSNTSVEQSRALNDFGAATVAQHPDRFGLLASLPMSDPSQALREIDRAWTDLQADGFVLVSNYEGRYLGDPQFEPVFARLDELGATVFLHPVIPPGFDAVSCGRPGPVFEFPVDTARTVVDALYAGVFRRHPSFRLVLAHAGGVLPTLAARLSTVGLLPWVPNPEAITAEEVAAVLNRLFYDTALAVSDAALAPLLKTTTKDHVLFGSDFPPAGLTTIELNLDVLRSGAFPELDVASLRANTLNLFPRLRARMGAPIS